MRYPSLGRFAVLLALVPPSVLMAQTSQPRSVPEGQFPPMPITISASAVPGEPILSGAGGGHEAHPLGVTTDWLQVGFDAGQTYFNPYETVLNASNVTNLSVLWVVELNAAGEANSVPQPLTTYADIIVAGDNGAHPSLSGLDETSGSYVWQNLDGNGAASIGNGVAFSDLGSQLSAVNATNGTTVWIANLKTGFFTSPLASTSADGVVLVSDDSGIFWAVGQATGKLLWNYNIQAAAPYPAAAANGRAFVCEDGGCYAFNRSGDLLWYLSGGGRSAVASGTMVFVSLSSGTFALDAATGHTIWGYTLGAPSVAAALANRILYTSGGSITALNAETGDVIWTAPVSTRFPVAVANGVLYANSDAGLGTLYAIDTQTGATLREIPTGYPATGPIVVNGRVFVGATDEFNGGAYILAFGVTAAVN